LPFIARVQGPAGTAGRWARARRWAGFGLLAATVLGYVALPGGPASAARAGLMALVGFGARQMGRPLDPWHALGVAGTALLAYQPLFALDLGFQMSFLAVGGILWALGAGRARPGEARMGAPGPQGTAALPRRPGGRRGNRRAGGPRGRRWHQGERRRTAGHRAAGRRGVFGSLLDRPAGQPGRGAAGGRGGDVPRGGRPSGRALAGAG